MVAADGRGMGRAIASQQSPGEERLQQIRSQIGQRVGQQAVTDN